MAAANSRCPDHSLNSNEFKFESKLKRKYDVSNQECCLLLSSMLLRAREMDNEYVEKYYEINMALLNNGGLTLVNKMFLNGPNKR